MGWFKDAIQIISGLRKWSALLIIISVSSTFLVAGMVSSKDFSDIIRYVGVAFMGANSIEYAYKGIKEWLTNRK